MTTDYSKLSRELRQMSDSVKSTLEERELLEDYYARPAYQQNDYLSWIEQAKRPETKTNRLNQMLDELEQGGVYMKMDHPASKR